MRWRTYGATPVFFGAMNYKDLTPTEPFFNSPCGCDRAKTGDWVKEVLDLRKVFTDISRLSGRVSSTCVLPSRNYPAPARLILLTSAGAYAESYNF